MDTLRAAVGQPDARNRPDPATWSPLEYACHVRDTCDVFRERIALVPSHDDPTFNNWDQDASAVEKQYADPDPASVASELDVDDDSGNSPLSITEIPQVIVAAG